METIYKRRFGGKRWKIIYGNYKSIEKFAIDELQRAVQDYLPYVIEPMPAGRQAIEKDTNIILTGTRKSNRLIDELATKKKIKIPQKPEGYAIACMDSPWHKGDRIIVLAGNDANGALYAVEDFNSRILASSVMPENPLNMRKAFDEMPDFSISEYPLIENRGIWTWGYVIYDYKRFIINMARLKMNTIIIWNDLPPINAGKIVQYAHDHGIKVILGFHWGWGLEGLDLGNPAHRQQIKDDVVTKYEKLYRKLGIDGIYFQTDTEHKDLKRGNKSVARASAEWVNDIAHALWKKYPDLYIQWGLHATSILQNYPDLKILDKKITIVWEDAGVLPYTYSLVPEYSKKEIDQTFDYSKKLATFRKNSEFAIVPKGWICLRWKDDFEHHGNFILGERNPEYIAKRLEERRPQWDKMNSLWLKHYPLAVRFYREILDCKPPVVTVAGLVEDGMFEEEIQVSVAIFAETLWNPRRDEKEILQLATSPYYRKKNI